MGAGSVEIPEGAWLRVETHETTLGYVTDGSGSYVGAYDWPLVDVTWVPSDTSGEWVRQSYAGKPSVFYGGKAAADAAAADYAVSAHEDEPTLDRAKAGVFTVGELGGGNSAPITEEIAAMPRDPQRLLDHLGADAEEDRSGAVIDAVAQALRSGIVPADLQAAMYQALALLPDVVITDDAADLDGRRGTAIGVQRADGAETDEIIVDPTTGLYLGQRQIQNRTIGAVPAHTVMDWTSVRTEIVFTAP
jgi:RNA polymerase sigma-70 factor (ECF subfamily)